MKILIVGAGLFGATVAQQLKDRHKVTVIEKRTHIGGNCYTENITGINVHKYGAHIFHTNNKTVWDYVNQFAEFNRFTNSPIANYKGELYSLPFNMYTFNKIWGVNTPEEAVAKIDEQRKEITNPTNLEEQAISLVGKDVYNILVKGYTEKQWGRDCKDLPAFIIKRLPVRFTYDNNYFNSRYQGIPIGGYTNMIKNMLHGVYVLLGFTSKNFSGFDKVIYTGPIDEYYDYCYGPLEYRSLRFENELLRIPNYQGNAVVNYTERDIPYTRVIEHKWFESVDTPVTYITREYPSEWKPGDEPFYPINDEKNNTLYKKYLSLNKDIIFAGRLGSYKYYDMDKTIELALDLARSL